MTTKSTQYMLGRVVGEREVVKFFAARGIPLETVDTRDDQARVFMTLENNDSEFPTYIFLAWVDESVRIDDGTTAVGLAQTFDCPVVIDPGEDVSDPYVWVVVTADGARRGVEEDSEHDGEGLRLKPWRAG